MPPHLFQNLIVALRAQSMEMEKKDSQLMWSLSHDHSRYNDHIYFKVSYCKEEWFVELQLRKMMTEYIEVRCKPIEDTSTQSIQKYWHIVYQNVKKILNIVCDTFPHTRHLKPMYGAYCWSDNDLHFSKYNEEKSTFLCNNCDWDKKEAMVWFQSFKEMDMIKDQFQPEAKDVEVQFDCFCPLIDSLPNAFIAGQKLFVIQGYYFHSFNWDECGLRLSCPQGALSSLNEKCEVAIVALAGGQFKVPVGTKLVSAVYGISVSKPLLKPLTLELQHCAALETKSQANHLKFVRAPLIGFDCNAEFTILEGGKFYPNSWYGSITRYHFCQTAIVQEENQSIRQHIDNDHQYITADRVAYFCKVYYQNVGSLEWSLKLSIVRRLKALEEYMRQKHPEAVAYCFDTVLPSGNSFKFVLDNNPPQGWSIFHLTTNSEFEYRFIDKFVSDELPEPPSCSMIIKAKCDTDTEEVFHYPVPLDGVDKPQQIFIYLSLKSNSVPTAGSLAVLETENVTFDVEKASKIAKGILKKYSASLGGQLHKDPLEKVIQRMYAENLVSESVNNSPDYKNMMSEYNASLELCRDVSEFMDHCKTFIRILSNQSGPLVKISNQIATDLTKEIGKQLQVNLKFAAE